jgi:non-ribosomal peptide synthetase component F
VVEHGSLCTSSRAHGTNRKIGSHTRLLQFAAYTFDVSVADIFTTLQRGGCICIPSEDERINDLAGAINRMNVNYGFLTPTVAGMLDPKTVPTLKTLILGGELLTQDNVQTWAPVVRLIISYGMTECSIHCVDAVPLTSRERSSQSRSAVWMSNVDRGPRRPQQARTNWLRW